MIGILLQDEKVPGVHLAFGDPYGSQTGADWKSRTHVDVLTRDCNVWIDETQVISAASTCWTAGAVSERDGEADARRPRTLAIAHRASHVRSSYSHI